MEIKEVGLDKKEVLKRLKEYGPNEIKEKELASSFKIFLRQIKKNFVIYLLFIAMILAFFVKENITAYTILAVIIVVIIVGFVQEYKAEKAIKALKEMLVPVSIVRRVGKEQEVFSRLLVPGDILILRSGEKIPADCLILNERELLVNESALTGESKEVKKFAAKPEGDYTEDNMLFMGTFVVNGRCYAEVTHTGMNTQFGKIAGLISTTEKEMPLQEKINQISKFMIIIAITVSILTGLLMLSRAPSLSKDVLVEVFILVIALAVSAFPEGFPVVMIMTLATGVHRMAKKNAIVNRMSIIETLGETTVICSDKTGTITKGEMTVKKIFQDNRIIDVTGAGYESKGEFLYQGKKIKIAKELVLNLLIKSAVLCNDAKIERKGEDEAYNFIGSPTEASLLIAGTKAGIFIEDLRATRVEEIPFNSKRKMMTVLCKLDKRDYVFSKGAVEFILEKCKFIQRENGIFKLTERERKRILNTSKDMASNSFRTIAFAYKKVKTFSKDHFEQELIFLGIAGMEDPPREEVKDAINLCKRAGIKIKMITGDAKETALAIAKEIGLLGKHLEGKEIDQMTDDELSKIVGEIVVFARVKPEHKLRIVKALKQNGEIVTMTGDGVNDAPALKESHIGVAMGDNGTDVSRSVADLTLKDDNFATIVSAVKEGRTIFKNMKKFVSYELSCNFAELAILFFGVLLAQIFSWQVPILLALQILFMNIVIGDLTSINLALTPYSPDIMDEKPRKKAQILNKPLIVWISIAGFTMALFTLAIFHISFNILHQSAEVSRTTALLSLIFLEIAGAYNFMSFRRTVGTKSFFVNKYLLYASIVAIAITLLIIYTPLNKIFGTISLGFMHWVIALLSAVLFIFLFNILKILNNKKKIFDIEHFCY